MRSAQSLPELAERPRNRRASRRSRRARARLGAARRPACIPAPRFRSWAWISAWWKSFSTGREPFVLVAPRSGDAGRASSTVRGALAARRPPPRLHGRRHRRLRLPRHRLPRRRRRAPGVARSPTHLAHESLDELSLDGILRGDPLLPALEGVMPASRAEVEPRYKLPAHHAATATSRATSPSCPTAPASSGSAACSWLEKQPGFDIECARPIPTPSSSASTRSSSCTTSAGRVEGGSDAIDGPDVEAFHRLAARALAERGWARLYHPARRGRAARRALRLAPRRSLRLLPGRLRSRVAPALGRHGAARPRRARRASPTG